jgi:type IV secretion system protein VirB9
MRTPRRWRVGAWSGLPSSSAGWAALPPDRARGGGKPAVRPNRIATERPTARAFENAIQVYPYRDGAIYQAFVAPGAVTDIALQPGETLIAVAAGDTARWVIGDTTSGSGESRRTHILVKPHATGLATNLVVTTDRRTYYLKLDATASTAMTAISWIYPADALIALRATPPSAAPPAPTAGLDVERLNFGYAISGSRAAWRPLRAFDDGRQTYLEFPASIASGTAPPLFVVGLDGAAELVNYRMRGRYYVIDRVFDVAELRLGTKKQQVVRIERTGETGARAGDRS